MSTDRSKASGLIVATHNLMHGLRIDALVGHYLALRDTEGLDLLCLQEDRYLAGVGPAGDERPKGDERPSARILTALGGAYRLVRDDGCPGLCLLYDSRTLSCRARAVVPLPRLGRLSWFEKLYIVGGQTKQKYVLLAEMQPSGGGPGFAAVCFHLDTAGGNAHRLTQVEAVAAALEARDLQRRAIVCGDTNAFAWRRQPEALGKLLAPLRNLGAADSETAETGATHFFARQNEPKLPHRVGVLLGKLGLDLPRRYDVVCTNLPVRRRGQVATPGSDHDLVWAALRPSAAQDAEREIR
jgi:endonuclease/exonuclease/phosphatase family metal-dependent hydrolase